MGECSCLVKYPNPMHKKENGKWKCVDDYECIRDLEIKMTKVGVSCVSGKTHCRRKEEKKMDDVNNVVDLDKWIDRFKNGLYIQRETQEEFLSMRFDNRDLKEIVYLLGELKAFRDNQVENESYHSGGSKQ